MNRFATVTPREFLPLVLTEAPGCPVALAVDAVRQAAREFCEQSRAWRHKSEPTALWAGRTRYPLHTFEACDVCGILGAAYGSRELKPLAPDAAQFSQATSLEPTHYRFWEPGEIEVYPIPQADTAAELRVNLALMPGRSTDVLPAFLLDRHGPAICQGAVGKLLMGPGNQPWHNPQMGAVAESRFKAATVLAKMATSRAGTPGGRRVRPRPFV